MYIFKSNECLFLNERRNKYFKKWKENTLSNEENLNGKKKPNLFLKMKVKTDI